jgi:hypothetical protein
LQQSDSLGSLLLHRAASRHGCVQTSERKTINTTNKKKAMNKQETQHTPTPWRFNEHPTYADFTIWGDNGLVPVVTELGDGLTYEQDCANARMIVRAVNAHADLVAALEACLVRLDEHDPQSVPEALQARAALAKAKGNQ